MARGREFQNPNVGMATAKLWEPKHVQTQGTNNNLESDEHKVMFQGWIEVGRLGGRYGFVGNAGDLELDAPLDGEPV